MEFQLIQQLYESKLFSSKQNLRNYTAKDIAHMCFLNFVALIILKYNPETSRFATDYLYQTFKYGNFDQLQTSTTDLGWMLHVLAKKDVSLLRVYPANETEFKKMHFNDVVIRTWAKRMIMTKITESDNRRFTLLLREMLKIEISDYESVRILVSDWPTLSHYQKSLALTRLLFAFERKMPRSELIYNLKLLAQKKDLFLHNAEDPEQFDDLNEHKMIKSFTEKWIKENAAASGTSAGAIASVVQPMGMIKRYKEGKRKKKSIFTEQRIDELFGFGKPNPEKAGKKKLQDNLKKLLNSWFSYKGEAGVQGADKDSIENWLATKWGLIDQETWTEAYHNFSNANPTAYQKLDTNQTINNQELADFLTNLIRTRMTVRSKQMRMKAQKQYQKANPTSAPAAGATAATPQAAQAQPQAQQNTGANMQSTSTNKNWTGARYQGNAQTQQPPAQQAPAQTTQPTTVQPTDADYAAWNGAPNAWNRPPKGWVNPAAQPGKYAAPSRADTIHNQPFVYDRTKANAPEPQTQTAVSAKPKMKYPPQRYPKGHPKGGQVKPAVEQDYEDDGKPVAATTPPAPIVEPETRTATPKQKMRSQTQQIEPKTNGKLGSILHGAEGDAVSALMNLGYPKMKSMNAVIAASEELGGEAQLDKLVKASLQKLSTLKA